MRIVTDAHIPFVTEAVRREWPDVNICPLKPEQIDAAALRNAEVLIVRTRTKVNEALLTGTAVRLLCTATIGYDHIDTAYCEAHNIRWAACPGCNAQAVCDYIEEALKEYSDTKTLGVVGVGHVGSLVAKMAERLGMDVMLNDPPKRIGVSLDEIAHNCDVITFHVPLTGAQADFPTYHMCDEAFLHKCQPGALIINAARGGVVDEQALLRSGHPYILDTWEQEPDIDGEVLQHAFRASMHIAGYSAQGKRNASQACLDTVAAAYGLPRIVLPEAAPQGADTAPGWLARITTTLQAQPTAFETLRRSYALR